MKKKSVLFVGSFYPPKNAANLGGQLFACTSLLSSPGAERFSWFLIDTTAPTNLKRPITVRLMSAINRLVVFFFYLAFKKIDAVLVFTSSGWSFREKGHMIRAAKFFGKRTVIAPRSGYIMKEIDHDPDFRNTANKTFHASDAIVCQGSPWKNFFDTRFQHVNKKTTVIHNWISPLNSTPDKKKISGELNVLFLGWVERNKGIYEILDAATELKDENFSFRICGHGKDFDNIKSVASDRGLNNKVLFMGWVSGDEKFKYLREAHVLVLPSFNEGLPNALLEAMQFGVVPIASNVGAIPDVITPGENGLLVDPGNSGHIVAALKELKEDQFRLKLSLNAIKTIRTNHDLEKQSEKIFALL